MSSPSSDPAPAAPVWKFHPRWHLRFRLTTTSPLHIGTGSTHTDARRLQKADSHQGVEYTTVFTDLAGKPCLPGASLKGVLRTVLETIDPDACTRLFGSRNTAHRDSPSASAVTIFDGRFVSAPKVTAPQPHWDPSRSTAIATSVSIHRVTHTADTGRLFHYEYVPAGTVFEVELAAERVGDGDIERLVQSLGAFNHPESPLRLGAHTSAGWGAMHIDSLSVRHLNEAGLRQWLASGCAESGWNIVAAHGTPKNYQLPAAGQPAAVPAHRISLTLRFTDFMLVHDPSNQDKMGREDKPHHALRAPDGLPVLPGRSVRGVLRARAEMILNTLGLHVCTSEEPCAPVHRAAEAGSRCLACQLFGCTGWRSLVDVSLRYVPSAANVKPSFTGFVQDFIAIDRFMGGGAPGAKFSAVPAWQPVFSGDISVSDRLLTAGASLPDPGALRGLLALVLRDLRDGELTFGWGAAKGYGSCQADLDSAALTTLAAGLPALRALAANCQPSASHVVS